MNLNDDNQAIFLSQNEMQYMMGLLGTQTLVGIEKSLLKGADPEKGRQSLHSRGLIQAGNSGENDRLRGDLLNLAMPVLFPQRALVVVKITPKSGTQSMIFLNRDQTTVLHSMPQNDTHRLFELAIPVEGIRALTDWFPFKEYIGTTVNVLIPSKKFDQFKKFAETNQEQLAMNALKTVLMPREEKMLLIKAFKDVIVSGSFALLTIVGNEISSAESLAIIADQTTAWAITSPDESVKKNAYRVRRTGDDLPSIFRSMFAWLGNKPID